MDCAGHQPLGKTVEAEVLATEHDFAHGVDVRQHADDEFAVEQINDVRCGPETWRLKLADLIGAANISDHTPSGRREVCSHRRSHVTKANKTDFALQRPAGGWFGAVSVLASRELGDTFEGGRGVGLVLGHGTSWSCAPHANGSRRQCSQLNTD